MPFLVLATPSESLLFPRVGSSNPQTFSTTYSRDSRASNRLMVGWDLVTTSNCLPE